MAHNSEWHAEYLRLENEQAEASATYRAANKVASRKNAKPAAIAARDTALEALRVAGKARWDFEMAATVIVDIATLPIEEWVAALRA